MSDAAVVRKKRVGRIHRPQNVEMDDVYISPRPKPSRGYTTHDENNITASDYDGSADEDTHDEGRGAGARVRLPKIRANKHGHLSVSDYHSGSGSGMEDDSYGETDDHDRHDYHGYEKGENESREKSDEEKRTKVKLPLIQSNNTPRSKHKADFGGRGNAVKNYGANGNSGKDTDGEKSVRSRSNNMSSDSGISTHSLNDSDTSNRKIRGRSMDNRKVFQNREKRNTSQKRVEESVKQSTDKDVAPERQDKQKDRVRRERKPSKKRVAEQEKDKVNKEKGKAKVDTEKPLSDYDAHSILRYVQDSVVGNDLVIETPYGQRKVVYCDYTASGRSLSFIEDYIRVNVMPTYANTHSTTGHNARQTGKYRQEARNMIKKCVNAGKDDVAIFTGSGATAGLNKLAWALKLNNPRIAMETAVFIGPYEHHSNILIWRELGTKVVRIRQEPDTGLIDLTQLQEQLQFWKEKRRHLYVCMSAASNVTGIVSDVDAICRIAHQHNALAIFDYAAGGPYLKIDMNPTKSEYKDAVILSPHKFVGGPGTPGLIIAKKWVFKNSVPDRVGGGTVRFVTRETHAYVGDIEEREEGGTPAIIESIRAGIVFHLKEEIGIDVIYNREEELCNRAFAVWERNPSIYVMGSHTAHRIPIFSFLTVNEQTGRLVHHNFISTLLSDLYGIQARGGCACAGPYAEDLMGISENLAKKYMTILAERQMWKDKNGSPSIPLEIMKPGFTRINLAYFIDDETADFVIQAVDQVTRHGWKLLPQYTFDIRTGSWKHRSFSNSSTSELHSLDEFDYSVSAMALPHTRKEGLPLKEVLTRAESILKEMDDSPRPRVSTASLALKEALPRNSQHLKWFLTPAEAAGILADPDDAYGERKRYKLPFKLLHYDPRTDNYDDRGYHSDSTILDNEVTPTRHSPEPTYKSPERKARSPERKRRSPERKHKPNGEEYRSQERVHHSQERKYISVISVKSPGHKDISPRPKHKETKYPEDVQQHRSPERKHRSIDRMNRSHDRGVHHSVERKHRSPERNRILDTKARLSRYQDYMTEHY